MKLEVGTRIKLTGKFLRSTGQLTGGEGLSVWQVVACGCSLCGRGEHIATNEESIFGGPRHFAVANVYKVGTLTVRNCP